MPQLISPSPSEFAELEPGAADRWQTYGDWEGRTYFPALVGLRVEEVRVDYARMRLDHRPELEQPAGLVHGGVIATLVDSVVVPAIGAVYDRDVNFVTLSLNVQYLGAVAGDDLVAEGWVTRRGRTVVFCDVVVRTAGAPVATGQTVYSVRHPR